MTGDLPPTQIARTGELLGLLDRVTVCIGLEAQGHIPTIEQMLRDGATWSDISLAIGWDAKTAARHYLWYIQRLAREEPIRLGRIRDLAVLMLYPGESSHGEPMPASNHPRPGDQHHG